MSEDYFEELIKNTLSDVEIEKMEHCIGWHKGKGAYTRNGIKYYQPHRNHFMPGGSDIPIWEGLKQKGYAECGAPTKQGSRFYWLTKQGLNILSAIEKVFIYSDNANGNEIDAQHDVLEVLLDDAVFCGYGCWLPTSAKAIALRARLPLKLTRDTLKYLQDRCGYVKHVYEGGCDDEGFPHCTHGWVLTKKWTDEHKERYEARQQEEYKRMDEIEKSVRREMAAEGRS